LEDVLYADGQTSHLAIPEMEAVDNVRAGSYTPYHPYDFDGSGQIDTADLELLAGLWLAPRAWLYRGAVPQELDADGVVDLQDLAGLARYWPAEGF
jgi:hypothetical protein